MAERRDYSMMPVQVEGEPTSPIRAVRESRDGMAVGKYVDVEFGSVWAIVGGKKKRMPGQWFRCQITGHEGAVVHVKLAPMQSTSQIPPEDF